MTPQAASAADVSQFADLESVDPSLKKKIEALLEAGVFEGTGDDSFGLQEQMRRAELAKVMSLVFDLKVDSVLIPGSGSFQDVTPEHWASRFIEAVKEAGLMEGTGNGEFDPSGTVTLEQLAAVLVRGLGEETNTPSQGSSSNVDASEWAKGYVARALELKLLQAGSDGTFAGTGAATRETLVQSAFETKKAIEPELDVRSAVLDAGNRLTIEFSAAIDPDSFELSNIRINGIPLGDGDATYTLSEDGKQLIVTLKSTFYAGNAANARIEVAGIRSLFDAPMSEARQTVALTVTNPPAPPVTSPAPVIVTAMPTADPAGGEVASGTAVALSTATAGASIYYTTDGSEPTTDSALYGGPIAITGPTTIKAFAVKAGETASAVMSASYTIAVEPPEDTTPPGFAATYPKAGAAQADGSRKVELLVRADEAGTAYYVVVAEGAKAPSAAQVMAGLDSVGETALDSGSGTMTAGEELVVVTEALPADATAYDVYVVAADAAGNATAPAKVDVTTPPSDVVEPPGDTTPPNFAPTYPKAGTVLPNGSRQVIFKVRTDEAGWLKYVVVPDGDRPPDAEQIESGFNGENGAALAFGQGGVEADTEYDVLVTLPADATAYDIYIIVTDEAGNATTPVKLDVTTPPADVVEPPEDTTPPNFAPTYPKAGAAQADGSRKVELLVRADEAGTAYYVVVAEGAEAPSAAQVMAGLDSFGETALDSGSGTMTAGEELVVVTEALPADATAYDVYVVAADAAGNATAPAKVDVTTPPSDVVEPPEDTTPPNFAPTYPKAGTVLPNGSRQVMFKVRTDEAGWLKYVVVPDGDRPPDAEQIESGFNGENGAALAFGQGGLEADMEYDVLVLDPLPADATAYDIYIIVTDEAGNATTPVKLDVTTPPAKVITTPPAAE